MRWKIAYLERVQGSWGARAGTPSILPSSGIVVFFAHFSGPTNPTAAPSEILEEQEKVETPGEWVTMMGNGGLVEFRVWSCLQRQNLQARTASAFGKE